MTIPHLYGFEHSIRLPSGGLATAADWDAIRLANRAGGFGFEETQAQWVARAADETDLMNRARVVSILLAAWGATSAVSIGAGTGIFEYHLAQATSSLHLRCGDFADASLQRLRERLGDLAEVAHMDLRTAEWVRRPDEPVMMHRVDTELSDDEWRLAFERLGQRTVHRIVWIPCGLLNVASMSGELRSLSSAILRRRRLVRAGYLRSERRMLELFERSYRRADVRPGFGLPIWVLESRR